MSLPRRARAAALSLAGLLAGATPAAAQAAPAGCTGTPSATWINVVLEGVRSSRGLAAVTLYADNSSKFLVKHGSLYVGRSPAHQGTTRTCIFLPAPGIYALAIYHDENGNQSFDRTGIGFPAEGYGFSNNPATLAGLPSFRSVRLAIPRTGMTTRIQMKYP
ncbi:MAG: DUF2141 domain-containing protein [Novosphingobium sp.]